MGKLGLFVEREVHNKHRIHESEVTESGLKKTKIEKILLEIGEGEKTMAGKLEYSHIQMLVELYQQVILFLMRLKRLSNIIRQLEIHYSKPI